MGDSRERYPDRLAGDPAQLRADATRYAATADALDDAVQVLRAMLDHEGYRSQAVDALRDSADDVGDTLHGVFVRYRAMADALLDYAPRLQDAQDRADRAIAAGRKADQDAAQAAQTAKVLEAVAADGIDASAGHHAELLRVKAQQIDAAVQGERAQAEWHAAWRAKNDAAAQAANRIEVGNDRSDLDDGFFDFLGDFFESLVKVIGQVLKVLSVVLTIVAVVVAVLALVFPALAAVAAALAGLAKLAAIASAVIALVQFVMDGCQLADVVVVGLAVAAAFGGGVLGKALGGTVSAAIGRAGAALVGQAAASATGQAVGAAVTAGVSEGVDRGVRGIVVEVAGSDAGTILDAVNGGGQAALGVGFADEVADVVAVGESIGTTVGADVADGLKVTGVDAAGRLADEWARQAADWASPVVAQIRADFAEGDAAMQKLMHDAGAGLASSAPGRVVAGAMNGAAALGSRFGASTGTGTASPGQVMAGTVSSTLTPGLRGLPAGGWVAEQYATAAGRLVDSAWQGARQQHMIVTEGAAR